MGCIFVLREEVNPRLPSQLLSFAAKQHVWSKHHAYHSPLVLYQTSASPYVCTSTVTVLRALCRTHPGPEQALSALVQGRACGLLATSSDLELGLLQSCFQLDDYEYLVKVM